MDCPECNVRMEEIESGEGELVNGKYIPSYTRYRCPKCKQKFRWSLDNI